MLATSPFATSSPHAYLPQNPSPLSPRRCSNGPFTPRSFHMTSDSSTTSSSSSNQQRAPFSQRQIKTTPTPPRANALRDHRREIFLGKVKQSRDDSRWSARAEDMARLDYVTQKRRWEAQRASEAPDGMDEGDEEAEVGEEEADEVIRREREELEALVERMEREEGMGGTQVENEKEGFGSDDEEYDHIFMDYIDEGSGYVQTGQGDVQEDEEMDMT